MTRLNHENEIFSNVFTDFDEILNETLDSMMEKGTEVANITIKMELSVFRKEAFDVDGDEGPRVALVPTVGHSINSVMTVKKNTKGICIGDEEIRFDEETGNYVTAHFHEAQTSMFDADESGIDDTEENDETHVVETDIDKLYYISGFDNAESAAKMAKELCTIGIEATAEKWPNDVSNEAYDIVALENLDDEKMEPIKILCNERGLVLKPIGTE